MLNAVVVTQLARDEFGPAPDKQMDGSKNLVDRQHF
jgi:hypothetical protein